MSQENKIPFLRNFSPGMNLMTVFSLVFLGTILGKLILWAFARYFWGINTFDENNSFTDLTDPSFISLVQASFVIYAICVFITPSTVFRRFMEFPEQDYFLIRKWPHAKTAGVILLVFLASFPANNFLIYVNSLLDFSTISPEIGKQIKAMEKANAEFSRAILNKPEVSALFLNLSITALITAIGEEILFRGVFQRLFIKIFRNIHLGVIVAAILFSLMHFSYYGFIPRLFMGVVLGYIFLTTANIWYCVVFHFLNNAWVVVIQWLSGRGYKLDELDNLGSGAGDKWIGFGLLVILLAFGIMAINKLLNKELVQEIKEY